MATLSCTRNRKSTTPRSIRLLHWNASLAAGVFQVTEGAKTDRYFFRRLASDFGVCFSCEKYVPETDSRSAHIEPAYDVCLDGDNSTCDCPGFRRWFHCRHVSGLAALVESGKLS